MQKIKLKLTLRYRQKIIDVLKTVQKPSAFVLMRLYIYLMTMKMRVKMKNRSQRYNINRPRPRHGHKFTKYKMRLSTMMVIMY